VLTGSSLGFGGAGWWAYRRQSPHEYFSNLEIASLANVFCNNPRNVGIWTRKSLTRRPANVMPPITIALMSTHAVMTKVLDITSSPGLQPGSMCITVSHALSGDVLMLNHIMSIRAHGSTLAKKVYHVATCGASAEQCVIVVKLLWDGRYIYKDKVGKTILKHLLKHWSMHDVCLATEPSAKRYRITGKSSCSGGSSRIS